MYTVCTNVNINFPFCSALWGKCLALRLLNPSLCAPAIRLVLYFCHSCHMQKRLLLSTMPFTVWFPFWRGYSSCIKLILSRVFSLKCSWKVLASPIWQGFEGNTKSNCKGHRHQVGLSERAKPLLYALTCEISHSLWACSAKWCNLRGCHSSPPDDPHTSTVGEDESAAREW